MRSTLPLLAALTLATAAAAQVTYYVDPVAGSDTQPGTSRATAVRSITYATNLLADDDRLILMPGTYSPSLTGEQYPIKFGETLSQMRVEIIAEGGPAVTILDGENQSTASGTPLMRFYRDAEGAKLEGLQFVNTGSASYWSMAIRLGSTSGGVLLSKDVEITRCIFRNCHRGIVIFGSDGTVSNPGEATTGCKIHDCLFENNTHRGVAAWGDGINHVFNNTFVNLSYEGVFVDSLGAANNQGPNQTVVTNNIVVGSQNIGGYSIGSQSTGHNPVFESNLAFNNPPGNYVGGTFPPSNIVADPLFVGSGDFHLQAGSPAIQTGSMTVFGMLRVDLDAFSRLHDSDGDGVAGLDRGCYQYTQYSMTTSGTWAPGGTVVFTFAAPSAGGGVVIFGYDDGAVPLLPFGILGIAPNAVMVAVSLGSSPGSANLGIPNDPAYLGARLITQGVHVGAGSNVQLLNVVDVTF